MKIIITEKQYNKLTEDKLQKLCYTVWNQQKKRGEEPHIDDIIYDITDIRKNSNEDFQIIRPIWYRYNGGFDNLFEKLKNEIDEKIFDLTSDWGNLDTRVQVIDASQFGRLGEDYGVDIFVNIDPYGTMDYNMYEEGTDNEIEVNDTIDAAYHEATLNYESSDLLGFLRGEVYSLFYEKLEKYGIPIDVDVDLKEF
jgi:hypothetical protein